jgi:molybdate transport system substrate-binding protein
MPSVDRVLALALGLLLLLAPRAQAEELLVFAAASLTDVLEELARGFESATGHRVLFNFAGSNDLARQIRAGAPADVFLSADVSQMDAVERDGLVRAGERVALLSNALVVVVPAHAAAAPASPAELVAVRRLALADPQAVPAGVYARRWLEARGLWPALRERVVRAGRVRGAARRRTRDRLRARPARDLATGGDGHAGAFPDLSRSARRLRAPRLRGARAVKHPTEAVP